MKNCFIGMLIMTLFSSLVWSQEPVELVVPYGAGGASDLVARAIAPQLGSKLDRNVVVINKPGGNTKIGTNYVMKNKPDGHTLILISSWIFLNPAQYQSPGFKIEDFEFLSPFGHTPLVLVVSKGSEIRNWEDFISHARMRNLNCGVHGEAPKLLANLLTQTIKMPNLQMVNYRTYGDHMLALMSGQIDCGIATKQELMKLHTIGEVLILAVSSSTKLPDLPNAKLFKDIDQGLSISAIYSIGMLSNTAQDQKMKILSTAQTVAQDPLFQSRLSAMGIDSFPRKIDLDGQKWAQEQFRSVDKLIQQSGIAKIEQ